MSTRVVFEWLVAFFLLTAIFVAIVSLATNEADKNDSSVVETSQEPDNSLRSFTGEEADEWLQDSEDTPENRKAWAEADRDSYGAAKPRSPKWPALQRKHLKLHPKCEACGTTLGMNVHHVKPFHLYPDLELDPKNLITLCRDHHFSIGHDPDGPWAPAKPSWKAENPNVRRDAKLWKARK